MAASVKRAVTSSRGWIYTGASETRGPYRLHEKGEKEKQKGYMELLVIILEIGSDS